MVERQPSKLNVAGSNPVFRSLFQAQDEVEYDFKNAVVRKIEGEKPEHCEANISLIKVITDNADVAQG